MTSGWISEFFNSIAPKRAFGVAGSNGVTGALSPSTAAAVPFAGVGVHDVGDELAFGATQDAVRCAGHVWRASRVRAQPDIRTPLSIRLRRMSTLATA